MKLYYRGFDPDLDKVIYSLVVACDGVWVTGHYEATSGIREITCTFAKEDDEDGFFEEVMELDMGVTEHDPRQDS